MKMRDIRQLDDKDEELAEDLISLGMTRPVSRTVCYLRDMDEPTSLELESGTGLRQPEVSIAMKQLEQYDWINEREEKKTGKGRPYKIYSLKVEFNNIIAHLEKQRKKDFNETMSTIKRLKKFGKD